MRRFSVWLGALLGLFVLYAKVAASHPVRVAVLDFTAAASGSEYESLGKGLQSMITTDLSQVSALSLVERARLRDLEAELKLAKSAAVDRKTAVRLGKLAGATHLLTGTFTVVGNTMRIDCHLLSVEDGTVVLADKVEGERDVFFELEKELVKKLVTAFGVSVAPKERAKVAKIHTADFEAFRRFSQSVDLFDAKKYEEAVATLRKATARDSEFELASYTLAKYESLIAELHAKAQTVETAQIDRRFLEKQQAAQRELSILDKLAQIAQRKKSDPMTRAVALGALLSLQASSSTALWRVEDRFALQRAADATAKLYWPLLQKLYPELPLEIAHGNLYAPREYAMHLDQIKDIALFDKAFAMALDEAKKHWPIRENHEYLMIEYTWKAIDRFEDAARRLTLDARGTAELGATLYAMGQKHVPDKGSWSNRALERVAKAFRAALDFDKSTAAFARLASRSDDPKLLKRVAEDIEENRDAEQALARAKPQAEAREYLMCRPSSRQLATLFPSAQLEPKAKTELSHCRLWPRSGYLLVGEESVWSVGEDLWSGARSEHLRTEEIVHYGSWQHGASDNLALWGKPRSDVSMRFEVDFAPTSFLGSQSKHTLEKRPEVSFVFGVRDVDVDLRDEKTRQQVRPPRAFALRFLDDQVQLASAVRRESRGRYRTEQAFEYTALASAPVALKGAARYPVQVVVGARGIDVQVAKSHVHFAAPKERGGFIGFVTRGEGLVALRGLKLTP